MAGSVPVWNWTWAGWSGFVFEVQASAMIGTELGSTKLGSDLTLVCLQASSQAGYEETRAHWRRKRQLANQTVNQEEASVVNE